MQPIQINFDNISEEEKLVENTINRIKLTKDCSNKSDNIALNHDLKNQEVDEFINVRIANGVININTFKITYLNEYVKSKLIKFRDIKPLNKPSSENTFKLTLSDVITLFNLVINSRKLILQLNIFSPISRIARDISEFIFIICSIKKYEEFAKIV